VQKILLSLLLAWWVTGTAWATSTPGAHRLPEYLPLLKGKRVALLINQTSRIGDSNLLDVLRARNVNVVRIFVPEHGFRGTADAGAHVASGKDPQTGLPVISLYGAHKKPKAEDLKDVDLVVYDLQDVGVRFYTYISSLEYLMEACAENNKQLIVLDRPNPNGFYVDGPVLEPKYKSFVGMQPIPVVYGMTVGEYAKMLIGERWVKGSGNVQMTVIPCTGYDHKMTYDLPVPPSPNLKSPAAVLLYPSLCLFEGTVVSVGRGTDRPFQVWGHPSFKNAPETNRITFTPQPVTGASAPLYSGQVCYGQQPARTAAEAKVFVGNHIRLQPFLTAYNWYGAKAGFFNTFLEKLIGTGAFREQVQQGRTEAQIQASWKPGVEAFKKIRKNYLLYPDFE
jgi:uncharacterized protein YbbC (DUF1343 family)